MFSKFNLWMLNLHSHLVTWWCWGVHHIAWGFPPPRMGPALLCQWSVGKKKQSALVKNLRQAMNMLNSQNRDLFHKGYIDASGQDCSISSALAMEILQSCTEPSIWAHQWIPFAQICSDDQIMLQFCTFFLQLSSIKAIKHYLIVGWRHRYWKILAMTMPCYLTAIYKSVLQQVLTHCKLDTH